MFRSIVLAGTADAAEGGLLALICAGSGICEAAVTGAVAVGGGYLVYKGVQAGVQIYQARAEGRLLDYVANKYCVDREQLKRQVENEKRMRGMPRNAKLTREEIEQIAQYLPRKPGCTPQG